VILLGGCLTCEELVVFTHRRCCEWPYNGISFWGGYW